MIHRRPALAVVEDLDDRRPPIPGIPPKKCPVCKARGEWPGQPCPECKEKPQADLDLLACVINEKGSAALRSMSTSINHAIEAGEALLAARAAVPKGCWIAWFEEHVSCCTLWTAHRWMRIAEHKEQVLALGSRSIEDAMAALADKPRRDHGPRKLSEEDKAALVELYHEEGMAAVMRAFRIAKSTVWRYVSDKSDAQFDPDKPRTVVEVTDEMIERMALWLVDNFGGEDYPVRVNATVRDDAMKALQRALERTD